MDQWEKGQSVARYHHNMKWQDGCFFFFFFFYKCYIFAQAALSFSSENNRNKCHSPGSGDMLCFLRGREAPLCPQPFIQLLPFSEPPYHFEPFSHFWPCHLHTQTALKVAIPHRTPPHPMCCCLIKAFVKLHVCTCHFCQSRHAYARGCVFPRRSYERSFAPEYLFISCLCRADLAPLSLPRACLHIPNTHILQREGMGTN